LQDIGLFAVTESQCTEDEHDDEDEDDSKFRNLGSNQNVDFDLANSEAAGEYACVVKFPQRYPSRRLVMEKRIKPGPAKAPRKARKKLLEAIGLSFSTSEGEESSTI
jgi:hypothetical protein